jgi:hypothetical protein
MNTSHVIYNGVKHQMECQHCGSSQSVRLPAPMDGVLGIFNEFLAAHKSCPATCDPRCAPKKE